MSNRPWTGAIVTSFLLFVSNSAYATECASQLTGNSSVTSIIECLTAVAAENQTLKQQVANLEQGLGAAAALPSGVVVAFDLSDGCPDGWAKFERGTARVILGAGNFDSDVERKFAFDENNVPMESYAYFNHGGEQKHKLTIKEMPKHTHPPKSGEGQFRTDLPQGGQAVSLGSGDLIIMNSDKMTGSSGGDSAHNNMPPYIALYFCKKG